MISYLDSRSSTFIRLSDVGIAPSAPHKSSVVIVDSPGRHAPIEPAPSSVQGAPQGPRCSCIIPAQDAYPSSMSSPRYRGAEHENGSGSPSTARRRCSLRINGPVHALPEFARRGDRRATGRQNDSPRPALREVATVTRTGIAPRFSTAQAAGPRSSIEIHRMGSRRIIIRA